MENYVGLSEEEAESSRIKNGTNKISDKKKVTLWTKFWMNMNNPIITILLIALGINIFFTFLGKVDWFECVGIFLSVLISTLVSTISEYKNESSFKKLQGEAARIVCKVYRDNILKELSINQIVKNDFVLLQAGDMIPADGFIVSGSIKADQSPLNGETKEAEKNCIQTNSPPGFWNSNQVFRGSVVCDGQAVMKVSEVGDNTLYGKLSSETQINEQKSPLNIKLSKLAKDISKFGYIGATLVFFAFLFHKIIIQNNFSINNIQAYISDFPQILSDFVEALIMCVTVLVVAVPDGLPLMIAIVCSLNMSKMLKDNVLVRKIIGIETSGGMNILFTDKTGTLTKGELTVTHFLDGDNKLYNSISELPEKIKKMMLVSILYNSGAYISDKQIIGGNATEKALIKNILNEKKPLLNLQKTKSVPFSGKLKYSECTIEGDYNLNLIKGAPEIILSKCKKYYDSEGKIKHFIKPKVQRTIDDFASNSERVIAFAYSDINFPNEYIFLCAASIKDEIRPTVKSAVREVSRAGIQVVMITGDKKETAVSIANECGILSSEADIILTSDEMNKMNDNDIKKCLPNLAVVARAVPADKSRLVRLAGECGWITGMTGDGVNDSPALKSADVGFAMGSGTDIAKEAGDIVILDDNFESIKKAVLYGRTIYKSIKKFITFQLTINIAAVSVSVLSFFFGIIKPLSIAQMLWINLLMDTLAAIAFGGEAALKKFLMEKPVSKNAAILDRKMWNAILVNGGFITLTSIFFFASDVIKELFPKNSFYTAYFVFFVFTSIFNAFNTRADGIDLTENLSANKRFLYVMGIISIIQIFITYFGGEILRTNGLTLKEWFIVMIISILIIPIDLIRKILTR